MEAVSVKLGFVKELTIKQKIFYFIAMLGVFLTLILSIKQDPESKLIFVALQVSFLAINTLPLIFPQLPIYQFYIEFNSQQIIYKKYFRLNPKVIDLSSIQKIEIKPTQVLIQTNTDRLTISFATISFKNVQIIKEHFNTLIFALKLKEK